MQTTGTQVAQRDFSAKTIRALKAKSIALTGTQMIPNGTSWINPTRAYVVNDNGTSKVWTHAQVIGAAA